MGVAHYLPQPPLPQMPGAGARRMARASTGRTVTGAVLPRRLHPAEAGGRDRLPEQGHRLWDPVPRRRAKNALSYGQIP